MGRVAVMVPSPAATGSGGVMRASWRGTLCGSGPIASTSGSGPGAEARSTSEGGGVPSSARDRRMRGGGTTVTAPRDVSAASSPAWPGWSSPSDSHSASKAAGASASIAAGSSG